MKVTKGMMDMKAIRPGAFSFKRKMNEIEHALFFTVVFLVILLFVLFVSGAHFMSEEAPNFIPPPPSSGFVPSSRSSISRSSNEFSTYPYFLPGTLVNLNRTQTLRMCKVKYKKLPSIQGCSMSRKYKILFFLTPKSGSSTGRHVIKKDFGGVDYNHESQCRVPKGEEEEWITMAVLRNPATRAFASYEEMFVRRLGNLRMIPSHLQRFMKPFEGWEYKNYSALFDTVDGVALLNEAYEKFMQDWEGDAFDIHLERQVAFNVRRQENSEIDSRHLNFVCDTHAMESSFATLARNVGLEKQPKVIRGRAYPRRLNVSHVSDQAYQSMCRIYKEDFCCLNYVLPPQCLKAHEMNTRVRCKWDGDRLEAVVV